MRKQSWPWRAVVDGQELDRIKDVQQLEAVFFPASLFLISSMLLPPLKDLSRRSKSGLPPG